MTQLSDAARLDALALTALMDSASDERFDRLTRLAGRVLDVPVALISLVDSNRQFFKSALGLPMPWAGCRETPLSHSFCQHVVIRGELLRVTDARTDPLVASNLAVRDINVIAYLGVPLRGPGAFVIGSLCAIDSKPREWTSKDERALRDIGGIVEDQIRLGVSERRWRDVLNTVPQLTWSAQPDGSHDFYNDLWYQFTGAPSGSADGSRWTGYLHADDREPAWQQWRQSLSTGDPYDFECRLRHHSGDFRLTHCRALALRDARGDVERWFGTYTEIQTSKDA